jgi:hypothetical protein
MPHVPWDRKADPLQTALLDGDFWDNENVLLRGRLVDFLNQAAQDSVSIADAWTVERFGLVLDPTLTNAQAARWARQYAGTLAPNINQTTRDAIKQAVATWIETPGATLRDLMDALPFDEARALTIAVTEATAAYAEGERLYTLELQKQYPTLRIVRVWFTNNDDRVCAVCLPLDGKEIPVDGGWGENGRNDPEGLQGPPAHIGCRCWSGRDVIT